MRFNRSIKSLVGISVALAGATVSSVISHSQNAPFAGQKLGMATTTVVEATLIPEGRFQLAGFAQPIEVTFGSLSGDARISGRAAVVEKGGGRVIQLSVRKLGHGSFTAKLVKEESLATGSYPQGVKALDLGTVSKGTKEVSISKEIDVWLYRSIAIIDKSTGRVVATAHLRSAQETGKTLAI